MKSPQEVLMQELSRATIGADFAFEPDEYKKGNSKREPADLVWACNNCIILMYMAQRKHKQRAPEAHVQMRQALIKHNLGQAKGWLSEWREQGQPLIGASARQKFHIKYEDFQHIIILSVLDCGDDLGNYHQTFVDQTGVALCATIAHNAILRLVSIGGSMLDLVQLIQMNREYALKSSNPLNLLPIINLKQQNALALIDPRKKWLKDAYDQKTNWVQQNISELRAPPSNSLLTRLDSDSWELGSVLNDIDFSQLYKIIFAIRELIDATEPNSFRTVSGRIELPGIYSIIIIATTFKARNAADLINPAINSASEQIKRSEVKGVITFIWDTEFNQIMMAASSLKEGLTNIEFFLNDNAL